MLIPQSNSGLPSNGSSRNCALCRDSRLEVHPLLPASLCTTSSGCHFCVASWKSCMAFTLGDHPQPCLLSTCRGSSLLSCCPPLHIHTCKNISHGSDWAMRVRRKDSYSQKLLIPGWAGHNVRKLASMKMGSAPVILAIASRSR